MDIDIKYKHIKHGYVRTTKYGGLKLSIPRWKKFDRTFKNILIQKWKQLLEKQKNKQKTKMNTYDDIFVRIRGEKISRKQIWYEKKHDTDNKKLENYLKKICLNQAKKYADKYSKKIWYKYNILKIKKVRSKWWSCSIKQNININLALVHLELPYLEYVVAHEVCHLQYKHHQKAFRELVKKIYPNYKIIKKSLKNISLV